jgi:hypothetical protein
MKTDIHFLQNSSDDYNYSGIETIQPKSSEILRNEQIQGLEDLKIFLKIEQELRRALNTTMCCADLFGQKGISEKKRKFYTDRIYIDTEHSVKALIQLLGTLRIKSKSYPL